MRRPIDPPINITTEFGVQDSYAKFGRHAGVDYAVPVGRGVFAPVSGTVTDYVWSEFHGHVVQIYDGQFYHRMLHNSELLVQPGQLVVEGQLVAKAGSTGLSTGPHVHWDIATEKFPGSFAAFRDPAQWLAGAYSPAPASPVETALQPYQRRVGSAGVNYRDAPSISAHIRQEFPAGDVLDFKGWVHGESVSGNDVWFVGRYTGGYSWSGSLDDTGTHDLDDLNPKPTPAPNPPPSPAPAPTPEPAPTPLPATPQTFKADSTLVKEVIPSPNFQSGNIAPSTIIVHQWNDPAKKPTLQGVTAWLLKPDNISPHYVVDDSGIYQFVRESDRAWHAGPNGNGLGIGIGIEFDPNGGEAMYEHGRKLVADIRTRRGDLTLTKHSDYMPTRCPDAIDLRRLEPVALPMPESSESMEQRVTYVEKRAETIHRFLIDNLINYKP